ncbi:Fic family protein [Rhizobacter sp. OV335]|uniref:Fic family protein n=1 Tax=Rhizobacter sp. OV335 TaxID=1500264 RepID=UPI00090F485D|nr:Fic family protein [Rhizobacter sp. OV335]SHN34030.1 Fic/DOC family protein [Rhizobacter sp. OV335]
MDIGFSALLQQHPLRLVQPLRVHSSLGKSRRRSETPSLVQAQFPPSYQPGDSFQGHFEFGLKYEEIHLEFLARLFAAVGREPLEAWCRTEPFGQYARRAGFLFEWLTGQSLDVPDVGNVAYVDALPVGSYVTRTKPQRNQRWRVNDNLPGTRDFCPLVRLSDPLNAAGQFDPGAALAGLDAEFGPDMLLRSASWLTFKESQASFAIEREADQDARIRRFAQVIAEHCGRVDEPLSDATLALLQAGILGPGALRLGIRRSPVFVGQASLSHNVVHYVAPHFAHVPAMLDGLKAFEVATRGASSLMRAGVLAFAFVYIHPMCDGNGRLHRFLVNDTLLRDGAIPHGTILPVSATIVQSTRLRADYDRVLEVFSQPLMRRYAGDYRFGEREIAADGTPYDFVFEAYDDAQFAWRFPDLTEHAIYTCKLIESTIVDQMAGEARVLRRFDMASRRLKAVIEMPAPDVIRVIRSLKENSWVASGKLLKEYPFLDDLLQRRRAIEAVRSAFEDRQPEDIADA